MKIKESILPFLGLFTLIFYASGQAVILQPIAISIGFGLMWGTFLNLLYFQESFVTLHFLLNNNHSHTQKVTFD